MEHIDVDTPFGKPSCPVMVGMFGEKQIAFINRHGQGHRFSPSDVPYAANIFALKKLGVHCLISTAAVGSLRNQISPGDLVVVDQFIDRTFRRTNSFFNGCGAIHCEMSSPVCERLHKIILEGSKKTGIKTHPKGTYVCMEGPQFSTLAESTMHRAWGGDVIGMTGMPEAKLAREAQMCYAMIALPSDYDCWRASKASGDKQALLREILGNLQKATDTAIKLIEAVLEKNAAICSESCSCRESLKLAVWTAKDQINPKSRKKLSVLFE